MARGPLLLLLLLLKACLLLPPRLIFLEAEKGSFPTMEPVAVKRVDSWQWSQKCIHIEYVAESCARNSSFLGLGTLYSWATMGWRLLSTCFMTCSAGRQGQK